MDKKLQELKNRRIRGWGNVTIKEFEKDIKYIFQVIEEQQKQISEFEQQLNAKDEELKETKWLVQDLYQKLTDKDTSAPF